MGLNLGLQFKPTQWQEMRPSRGVSWCFAGTEERWLDSPGDIGGGVSADAVFALTLTGERALGGPGSRHKGAEA